DLGIDTVKQAEMFGIIREKWNLPREEGIRIQEYSTVNKIADYILSRIGDTAQETSEVVAEKPVTTEVEFIPAKRLTLQLIEAPLPKLEKIKLKDKKFVVASESNSFSSELITLLESKKVNIVKHLNLKKLKTREKIIKELPTDEIDGLIYVEPKTTQKNKHNLTARIFFSLCREITYSATPIITAISNTDTSFGWTGQHTPISGSLTGFTKSISREFTNSTIKCISCLDPKLALNEIISGDGSIEVSYSDKGMRYIFITKESPIVTTEQPFTLTKEDLILITGGALGITYEITKEIASKYQPKLALLGIEKLIDNIDEIASYDSDKLAKLKDQLISDLKQKHDRVTPVLIEREWSKITKAIDIKKAIQYLTSVGCKVKYYSADVVNTELMISTLDKIKSDFDQEITGIVHGAGLEISKLIADKKPEEFDLVYNVKTIGFDNLVQNINLKNVKFLKCFSSVAGRFGNAGQVDYSAANDYLSKNCWQLRKKGIRATSICWSAWGEVGMATRGSIMKVLKHVGVTPISVNDGVNAFMNELEFGTEAEVVIVGKIGALLESPSQYVQVDRKQSPLIGKIRRNFDGSIVAEREFSLEDDLYLNHHRFDNIPFLPGVIGLEIFAELAKLVYPKLQLVGFKDVEFKSAVKFTNDKSRVLKSYISFSDNGLDCILTSEFVKDGVVVGNPTIHFKANVLLGKRIEEQCKKPKLKETALADKKVIYTILPHGPLFQVLKEINDVDKEIIAKASINGKNQFSFENKGFTSPPLVIESGFQTMGLLDIIKENKLGLPLGIKSLVINKTTEPPTIIRGTKIRDADFGSVYNFEILTKSGQVVLKAEDYSTALVDFGADLKNVEEIKMQKVKRLFKLPKESSIDVAKVDTIKSKTKTDPDYVNNYLHAEERAKFKAFKVDKRRFEWLTGIIAAKRTIRLSNPDINYQDILIEKTAFGKPFVKINRKTIPLSISHSNGYAVAVSNGSKSIGIDLEQIEPRDDSFVQEMLSPTEIKLLKDKNIELTHEIITKIWTAKEAVLKALGIGLNIDLHYLKISTINDNKFILNLETTKIQDKVKASIPELKGKSNLNLKVNVSSNDKYAAALCFI
ncbi:MAG: KR domain-containing protein, partial [Asgard group archaeon]|nr:KR domain-containing protein [Asgard group archaeon]